MGEVVIGTDFVKAQTALERERYRRNIRRELVKRQQLREELCSRTSQPHNDDNGGRAA